MITCNIQRAEQAVIKMFKANFQTLQRGTGQLLVPFVKGSPAMGKTSMARAVAKAFNLFLIDIRVAQEDPVCLNGALSIKGDRSEFLPPSRFPLTTDTLPTNPDTGKPYAGWLVTFDELPDAPKAIQSACYKILLEREIGQYKIHPKAYMMAMGNHASDKAGVSGEMSSALKSRLVHINVNSDSQLFLDNISKWGWDLRLQAYLSWKPENVNTFKAYNRGSADDTYPAERTWDMVNSFITAMYPDETTPISSDDIIELAGMIGSIASEFITFTQCVDDQPKYEEIIANPSECRLPDSEGAKYLLMSMLSTRITEENHAALVTYVRRMGKAYPHPFIRMAWKKDSAIAMYPEIMAMLSEYGKLSQKI